MQQQPKTTSTSPLRVERMKRSWTQEHLAETTGLSVRTIQRIETGESVNAESVRRIAEALGVDIETLKYNNIRLNYSAPWAKSLKIMTAGVVILLLSIGIYTLQFTPWILDLMVAFILICFFFSVQGYSINKGQIWIHRVGWSTRFDLKDITDFHVNPHATVGSIRLFGTGGFFAYTGYFSNDILGRYRAFMTNPSNALVIKFGPKTIVITPDNPELLANAIEEKLQGIQSPETV